MFDLDGTLVLGDRAGTGYDLLPGAAYVLRALRERAVPFVLLTNGTHRAPADAAAKLRSFGLPVEDVEMLTPSSVAADYLTGRGAKRVLVLGVEGASRPLADAGVEIVRPGEPGEDDVAAVYVAWHPKCDMEDIEAAARAVWAGAELTVASDAPFFATRQGRALGYSRAIIAAIRAVTDAPATLLGKPSEHALAFVARKLGAPPDRIGVVGDDPRIETSMARAAGAMSFGVATGLTDAAAWAAQPPQSRPDHVLATVGDLLATIVA
jgi:NagD protein